MVEEIINSFRDHHTFELIDEHTKKLEEFEQKTNDQNTVIANLERDISMFGVNPESLNQENQSTLEVLEHLGNQPFQTADGSIASILTVQRDRLRQKVSSLEEELVASKTKEMMQQTQIEKLMDDNVKLYGKIKYLQGYGNKATAIPVETAKNYGEQYEQKLNPFTKFSQLEKHRTYKQLKLHDRATLTIGKAIMSSGTARLLFFFYLVILHLMVFLVLYRYAFSDLVDQSFQKECVENFALHMKKHHSDK